MKNIIVIKLGGIAIENLNDAFIQQIKAWHLENKKIIIVEDIADLWALERSMIIRAKYHVLGGHLSPLNGIGEDDLNLKTLNKRVQTENFLEIIFS